MENNMNQGQQYGGTPDYNNGQQYGGTPNYNNGQQYGGAPNYDNGQQYGGAPNYNNGQQYGGAPNYYNNQPYADPQGQNMYNQYGYSGTPETPKKSKKGLVIGLVIGGVVVVAAAVMLILIFVVGIFKVKCKTPKEVAERVTEAFQDKDADVMIDMMGKYYLDYVMDEYDYDDIEEIRDELAEDLIDNFYDDMDWFYGTGKVKSITLDDVDIDKYSGSELEYMQELFDEEMDCDLEGYAEMTMVWEVEGADDDAEVEIYMDAYQVDGVWYWFTFDYY